MTLRDLDLRALSVTSCEYLRALNAEALAAHARTLRSHLPALQRFEWRDTTPGQRAAVAAAGGLTVGALAAVALTRRRRGAVPLAGEPTAEVLPDVAPYPGPDPRWDRIAIGVHADGEQAAIRLGYTPHILLVGPTGSGKSVTGRNILLHALAHADDWNIVGVDLFRCELFYLHGYDNVSVATTLEETVIALANVSTEMDRRYASMEQAAVNHFRDLPAPPKATLVYVDEVLLLAQQPATNEAEATANFLRSEVMRMVGTIARLGRAAGIHLVLAAQYADASLLGGDLDANLDARIVMGKHNKAASELVLGTDAAAHLPSQARGRGLLSARGRVEEFQSYWAPQDWYATHAAAQDTREQSIYHPISLLRTPSGIVVTTDTDAISKVAAAVTRLDAFAELTATVASTPAQIKQALRRGADVIGYVGSLEDPKVLDRLIWAGTVGCVVYVAAPQQSYDDVAERLTRKADQRQVGCQIVADA